MIFNLTRDLTQVTFCVGEEPEQVVTTTVSPEHPFFVTAGAGAGAGAGESWASTDNTLDSSTTTTRRPARLFVPVLH